MIIGLVAILLFGGFLTDVRRQMQTGYVQRMGHLQLMRKDYLTYGGGNPAAYAIADYERIIDLIKADSELGGMVEVATPVLQFGGIAGNFAQGVSRTVVVNGVVARDQERMRRWNDYGLPQPSGGMALAGTAQDAAVIGTGLARTLKLCLERSASGCGAGAGEAAGAPASAALPADIAAIAELEQPASPGMGGKPDVEVVAANAHGAPNVLPITVVKAENQGIKAVDDAYVAMHFSEAQRLFFGKAEPKATAIAIQLKHTDQIPAARACLQRLLASQGAVAPLEILDFQMLNPFYGQAMSMLNAIFGFISALIGIVVLFSIGNTLSMIVMERTVEIGTLRAIGLRRSGIMRLFLSEGVALGLAGAAAGICAALAAALAIGHSGLVWTLPGRAELMPLSVAVSAADALRAAGFVIAVSVVSAVLPAAKASRMNIVDALRHT